MKRMAIDKPFKLATIGGTFDTLHQGHKDYISIAFHAAESVHIFLASDDYAKYKKTYLPHSYIERKNKLEDFLALKGWAGRYQIFLLEEEVKMKECVLHENYEIAVVEPAYIDFFVKINQQRELEKKAPLFFVYKNRTLDMHGKDMSSTSLRSQDDNS